MKTKKVFLVLNIIFLIAIVIGNILYFTVGGTKTETSLCFATLGLINLAYAVLRKTKNIKVPVAMAVGLVLAMLGDITIDGNFVVGAGLFALGHIGFFVAYCLGGKFGKWDAILSTALFSGAGCFVLFSPILTFDVPVFKWVCLAYALIISLMVGKAVGNLIREKTFRTFFSQSEAAFSSSLTLCLFSIGSPGPEAGAVSFAWELITPPSVSFPMRFTILSTKTPKNNKTEKQNKTGKAKAFAGFFFQKDKNRQKPKGKNAKIIKTKSRKRTGA